MPFITNAFAQSATSPAANAGPLGSLASFLPMILIFGVFYFLLIRPQQKQQKLHKEMISGVKRGDEIVTSGGIHGKVTEVSEETVKVQIDTDTVVKMDRSQIQTIKGLDVVKS